MYVRLRSEPALELHSRAASSVSITSPFPTKKQFPPCAVLKTGLNKSCSLVRGILIDLLLSELTSDGLSLKTKNERKSEKNMVKPSFKFAVGFGWL